jgi:phenylacetate-CoA ligase
VIVESKTHPPAAAGENEVSTIEAVPEAAERSHTEAAGDNVLAGITTQTELAHAFFNSMRASERLPPAELKAYQDKLASKLLQHAVANTAFYRETIGARLEELDLTNPEDWRTLPTTDRGTLASRQADLRATEMPKNHGELRTVRSGGSTGAPITIVLSDLESTGRVVATYRMFDAYQMDPGLPLMMIRHPQFGSGRRDRLTFRKWSYPWLDEEMLGDRIHVDITTPASEQLARVEERAPLYLNTLPSNLLRLAMEARKQEKDISIPVIISVAEYLPPEVRRLAEETFGSRIVDVFSSSEAGVTAIQCPMSGQYHVQSELVLVEVLGADGQPSMPGETGEIVVTPFYNYATPVIRYRTGDYAIQGEPCPCGRSLPTLTEILGRKEHLFLYPDGSRRRPPIDHVRLTEMIGHDVWQLSQETPTKLVFRYAAPASALDSGRLQKKVSERVSDDFEIAVEECQDIPLTSGGKRNYIQALAA